MNSRHARRIAIGNYRPRQYLPACIEYPHDVTVADPARAGILWVNKDRLLAANGILLTQRFRLAQLGMQTEIRVDGL